MDVRSTTAGERRWTHALFALWCLATIAVLARHEPWRDEADAWLVARDATAGEIWRLMGYAGTPSLWYWVQWPFAKLGLPYAWQKVAHWPWAAAVAWLVLYRAPLPLLARAPIAFSYFLAYEYAVVARGYAMTLVFVLGTLLVAAPRWTTSWRLPLLLAGAANATLLGLFFAVSWQAAQVAAIARARLRGELALSARTLAPAALGWLGSALAVVQMWPPDDGQKLAMLWNPGGAAVAIAEGVIAIGPTWARLVGAAALLLATCALARRSPLALWMLACMLALLFALFACKHLGHLRHWGFAWIAIVAAQWIALSDPRTPRNRTAAIAIACLAASAIASTFAGVRQSLADWSLPFSNAEAMARHLRERGFASTPIAAHRADIGEAVLPYFDDLALDYPALERRGTHMLWDAKQERTYGMPVRVAAVRALELYGNAPHLLLLSSPLQRADALGYRLLHVEDRPLCNAKGESYWLYAAQ